MDKKQVGNRIQVYRKSAGLTQIDLSAKTGISQSKISKIENGSAEMMVVEAIALCKALRVKIDRLLGTNQTSRSYCNESTAF